VKATSDPKLMLIINNQNTVAPIVKKEIKMAWFTLGKETILFNGPLVIVRGIWTPTLCNVVTELWFTS